ncbi:hypothetical protein TIFTF001_041737 [Ficus carica]|uniref:Uncharacterized protein n=1 Tax=Ficus carica TaxID=3494 RepID=A0AA87ZUP9_FICCA|nr:hypothetical protein TIFTF001_041737 [Ficus carica]
MKSKITWISINQLLAAIGAVGPSNSGAFIRMNRSYNRSSHTNSGFTYTPTGAIGTSTSLGTSCWASGWTSGTGGATGAT